MYYVEPSIVGKLSIFPSKNGASGGWAEPYLSRPRLSPRGGGAPSRGALALLMSLKATFQHPS